MEGIGIGTSDFKKLRIKDYYYIDKTMYIKDILDNKSEIVLVTRPRRFGKTLNMSMHKKRQQRIISRFKNIRARRKIHIKIRILSCNLCNSKRCRFNEL